MLRYTTDRARPGL